VVWYTERSVTNISLGSVMVMVLVRTIQVNIAQIRVGGEGVRVVLCEAGCEGGTM